MTKHNILQVLFLLCTVQLFAQTNKQFDSEAITKMLLEYTDEEDPGLAVGIVKDGEIIYEHYQGYANLDHKVKINPSTRSNIASTAKQFTALMILQLSMEGKLSLEDDIRTYMPTLYPKIKEEIKIRHLINHTSGIRDYVFILEIQDKPFWRQFGMDNDDVIELLEQQEELVAAPGSHYDYSNSNYTIMAEIIEKISEQSFNEYSKAFFESLGMNETAFIKRYMSAMPNRANPYSDWGYGEWFQTPMVTKFNGDGALYTTLKDQLTYEQAVQNAVKDNNQLLIKSQKPIPNSEIQTYGFGLELEDRLGRVAQCHSGSTFGYHSHTSRFPKEKISIFVLSNNETIWSGNIADKVATAILPPLEEPTTYDALFTQAGSESKPSKFVGQYVSPDGYLARIVEEDGKILWKNRSYNPYELISEEDNVYSAAYNSDIKIRFYADKLVRFYTSGNTITYQKQSNPPATLADLEDFVGHYRSRELDLSFEIKMTDQNTLEFLLSNEDEARAVEAFHKNELLASNYILKAQRDHFDRVTDVFVTLSDRAKNNRFKKETNFRFQPKIEIDGGSIQVTTIGSQHSENSDILLTKNDPDGNEIWFKRLGGKGYDKASSIVATDDGYLIIGSTSSYGNGNYDIYVIKTDKEGNQQWQNTYGAFYNEYGYVAETTKEGYLLKGTKQHCTSNSDVFNRECTTRVWFVSIDANGKELANEELEAIPETE